MIRVSMYIQVRLLKGYQELLWYKVPIALDKKNLIGVVVKVPLRNRFVPALVQASSPEKPSVSFEIKYADHIEPFPDDVAYYQFIKQLSHYYQMPLLHFFKRIHQFLVQKEHEHLLESSCSTESFSHQEEITLTHEQQAIVDALLPSIIQGIYKPSLLHGVTGSGKTEIYKRCIMQALTDKKTALLLLPEVSLAVRFAQKLKEQLPTHEIFSFHSATGIKEKRILWQALIAGRPLLIIGVHLPILLPLSNLGLIIIDEEHDIGFQEKKHPKINSKEAALLRAQLYNVPIILGSATPSIASLFNVHAKQWQFFQLKNRFAGTFPKIEIVSLADKKERKNFWISRSLEIALKKCLEKREQAIIFLNRRGFSFFVQCKLCSFVFCCLNCSVSLTLHQNDRLRCHYCGSDVPLALACPSCNAGQDNFLKKGIGTQQLVTILQKIVPHARIERADLDATINKKKWQSIMNQFEQGDLDILVGTQTITKGYHFPRVTLVGILWADLNIHFPLYNASETTLQQLIQVAGRAGRSNHSPMAVADKQHQNSLVIVQTMMEHPIFSYLHEVNYLQFFKHEYRTRKEVGYPPCVRLAEIELKHTDESVVHNESFAVAQGLLNMVQEKKIVVTILGPALPPVYKIKKVFIRKIYLKSNDLNHLIALFAGINITRYKSSIFFTPNPLS